MSFCGLIAVLFFFFLPIHCMDMASQVAQLVKNLPASARKAGDVDSVSGLGRSPGRRNGNLFQDPCLEISKDRGAWWATVHGVTKSWTQLRLSMQACVRMHQYLFTCWRASCLLLNFSSYKAAMNIHAQVFVWMEVCNLFWINLQFLYVKNNIFCII